MSCRTDRSPAAHYSGRVSAEDPVPYGGSALIYIAQ